MRQRSRLGEENNSIMLPYKFRFYVSFQSLAIDKLMYHYRVLVGGHTRRKAASQNHRSEMFFTDSGVARLTVEV